MYMFVHGAFFTHAISQAITQAQEGAAKEQALGWGDGGRIINKYQFYYITLCFFSCEEMRSWRTGKKKKKKKEEEKPLSRAARVGGVAGAGGKAASPWSQQLQETQI